MKEKIWLKYHYVRYFTTLPSERKGGLSEFVFIRAGGDREHIKLKDALILRAYKKFFKNSKVKCRIGCHPETGVIKNILVDNDYLLYYEGKKVVMIEF